MPCLALGLMPAGSPLYDALPSVRMGRPAASPHLLRQYLYFCTSKASKLSTCNSAATADNQVVKAVAQPQPRIAVTPA